MCIYNVRQPVKGEIASSKETSRVECAKICRSNPSCVGFEFDTKTKQCSLSKTSWRESRPTSTSYKVTCEKKDGKGQVKIRNQYA